VLVGDQRYGDTRAFGRPEEDVLDDFRTGIRIDLDTGSRYARTHVPIRFRTTIYAAVHLRHEAAGVWE
jgi:hypothetical protein